jgi:hypothetical protein
MTLLGPRRGRGEGLYDPFRRTSRSWRGSLGPPYARGEVVARECMTLLGPRRGRGEGVYDPFRPAARSWRGSICGVRCHIREAKPNFFNRRWGNRMFEVRE